MWFPRAMASYLLLSAHTNQPYKRKEDDDAPRLFLKFQSLRFARPDRIPPPPQPTNPTPVVTVGVGCAWQDL